MKNASRIVFLLASVWLGFFSDVFFAIFAGNTDVLQSQFFQITSVIPIAAIALLIAVICASSSSRSISSDHTTGVFDVFHYLAILILGSCIGMLAYLAYLFLTYASAGLVDIAFNVWFFYTPDIVFYVASSASICVLLIGFFLLITNKIKDIRAIERVAKEEALYQRFKERMEREKRR